MLETMKKWGKKILVVAIGFSMVIPNIFPVNVNALDIGSNPTPVIDIAVNVPSDYPGTFLDFKQELTQKLIDQGLDPSTFRITNTAVSIDTSSMDGWIVYDHYYDNNHYNRLVPEDQRALQPYRGADNTHASAPGADILSYINKTTNKFTNTACVAFNRHIGIYQSESGASNMAFAGYGTNALSDYMIYPAPNSTTRTFSFNIDASVIDTHTLSAFGFWMNAAVENGKTSGYLLYFDAKSAASGNASISIRKVNDVNANSETSGFAGTVVSGSQTTIPLGTQKKVRLTVELKKESVTIQQQAYDGSGNLSDVQTVLRDFQIPQFKDHDLNGLGPWVGYASHGCSGFSAIVYTDLEMTYEASAFDALKYVQYYEGAEYKYFINLAGDSGNPNIPKEHLEDSYNQEYSDGINRMNENDIFYISNVQDGLVVTDSEYEKNEDGTLKLDELGNPILARDENGNIIHQGLGSSNGCIASSDDYASQMADFISKNFFEKNHFQKAPVSSELPLANFYVKNTTDDSQLMTIHLQHLVLNNETITVNIKDKSKIGLVSGKDGYIKDYRYFVYDPTGKTVVNSGWVEGLDNIPDYTFTKDSVSGTYVFELTVRDQAGNESKTFQTYLTAYLDNEEPFIEGKNTARNKATITLTDTGEGIDDDGITFIKDGRGSGVAAYWVTNDVNAQPGEYDWEELNTNAHQYSFDIDIESTDPIIVWVKDECGNIGNKAVFQPIHVKVEDADGNPIDDYFVFGDKPIIVLPDDEDVPPSEDDDEYWSGWETPDKDPVTPGTTPPTNDENEIVIRPSYSKDQAALVYLPNSGLIDGKDESKTLYVTGKASILKKVDDQNVIPTRTGYTFTGWKLLKSHNAEDANNSAFINNASNVEVIKEQLALSSENAGKVENFIEDDYYYLVAQWEISTYTLKLDANGGSLGNVRSIEHVPYDKLLTTVGADISNDDGLQAIPTTGRANPTKPGYIFQGWSTSKNDMNKVDNTFILANGISGITLKPDVKMPSSDMTIYAVWKTDTNKFVVHFNSNGGSTIKDHAYVLSAATNYDQFSEPQRAGYTFDGWYREEDLNDITVESNGTLIFKEGVTKPTVYTGGEAISPKAEHTFVAMWTPNKETKYTVDYYINSGTKDANGKYIYTKVAGVSKNYLGATESKVSVKAEDKTAVLTVDGKKYWYNKDNANNILNGTVTGNPTLSLKLYYDRYFDVITSMNGKGTVTGATDVKEGLKPTVSWKPADGYHVEKVVIDGIIRDDLLKNSTFTYPNEFHENHTIYVEFAKDAEKPIVPPAEKLYEVRTKVLGCTDSSKYEITPTIRVKEGLDKTVTWDIKDSNYHVKKVTVDGVDYDITKNEVSFKGISANHEVIVTLEGLPSMGGDKTNGNYTVTVNRYGGDGKEEIDPSVTVKPGDSAKINWDVQKSEYQVYKVVVDGIEKELTSAQKTKHGYHNFNNIKGNHVIDIYLTEVKNGQPETPSYSEDEYIKLNTQIIGGPGTITGGAYLKSNSDYDVEWNLDSSIDVDSPDYTYYEVDKVVVDGKTKDTTDGKLSFTNLQDDTDVKVYVKPVMYNVTIKKYGEGTVSESKRLYKHQNYKDITQSPAAGWETAKIIIDGEEKYSNPKLDIPPVESEEQVQPVMFRMARVVNEVMPIADDAPSNADIMDIQEDHIIEVYFTKSNPDGTVEPLPDLDTLHEVNVKIDGGIGKINGGSIVKDGESSKITWEFDDSKYEIDKITVNGKTFDIPEGNEFDLSDITEDKDVVVTLKEKKLENNDDTLPDTIGEKKHIVTAIISGASGIITGGGEVASGGNKTISWVCDDPDAEIAYIFVNGEMIDITSIENELLLENIKEDTSVVVVMSKPNTPPVNVDKDDDGKPDINIDTDGDGIPDVDVDTDKDGKPDINIDTDKDGKPDIDIDTDGDNKPDINIDTDKDGKPDINVDTDGDNKPDINVDTDKDGKPDINIDTDGDNKPDINVDTDGDDLPDVNIDTDGDNKPDINVDTDGDNKPDINIDTDGDNKPDVNVDTDGDNKPDINVDTDGDNKPDVNIDTDGDNKPDINIDTNGDGKPNINIDTDRDGKPNINIDTDGDGKADINIDTDGDGKADINIDTDGDGKPDINIDLDGDGKPDTNIVSNGKENVVQTGDDFSTIFDIYMMTAYLSLASILFLLYYRRRYQKD